MSVTSQSNYERGERSPDADYLAAVARLGFDVQFVVTGVRGSPSLATVLRSGSPAVVLTAEESALVDNYRHAGREGRRALAAASAALAKPGPKAVGD